MSPAEAVRAVVHGHAHGVPTFDALRVEACSLLGYEASVTEIDTAARPYEVGPLGAYRYERVDGPGHCPCQSDVDDIGPAPHLAACQRSDEGYPRDGDGEPMCPF